MSDVHEINDLEALRAYRWAWQNLLDQTPGASFFQSLDWLEVYWRHFGAGQKLRVLAVLSGGRLVGILPLAVCRERTRVGTVRVLTYPLHDWGSFYGPIGPDPGETLSEGLEYVARKRRDWDVLELRWVDAGGLDRGETKQAMQAAGLRTYETVWDRTAVVDLAGTWDDYLASRPAKWRNNFRRQERKLQEQGQLGACEKVGTGSESMCEEHRKTASGEVHVPIVSQALSYLRYRPRGETRGEADPRWDLYDACEALAQRSWQGTSTTGTTLSHESIRAYLRETHAVAARAGAVDLNLLLLGGRPAAFAYNYHWGGRVCGVRAGYDAGLSRRGAGGLLLAYAIRDSFQRGDRLYDLGVGYLRGKRYLATRIVPIHRYSHFHPKAVRAQLLRVKRWVQERLQRRTLEALALNQ